MHIPIKRLKEEFWDTKLSVNDFALQITIIDEDKDTIYKLWLKKLLDRFFEGMGKEAVRTVGQWTAELEAFMDHLLSHQPTIDSPHSYKLQPVEDDDEDDS